MTGFAGTADLIRLAARRDRVMLPVWVAVFAAVAAFSASATVGLYPDVESRVLAAASVNGTPSLVALYGWIYDPASLGALAMWKLGGLGSSLVAVLGTMTVIRHTRAEEESGRLELLGGGVVGRYAALTAALTIATGACLTLGVVTAFALLGADLPVAGSVAFGLTWGAVGCAFAAVAGVAAQLTRSARSATGIATAVLGAAFLLRAVGDSAGETGSTWPSWLSPIGWGQQVRPYAGERWWVFGLLAGFVAVLCVAAYALAARRDLGAGLLQDRAGPGAAGPMLSGPLGLAWRLQRGPLLAQVPGTWVLVGIVTALFGLAPRFAALGWAALVGFLLLTELGPLLHLKQWVMDLSPFAHLPKLPGGVLTLAPLAWLTAVAAALTAAGLVGFRRRDVG